MIRPGALRPLWQLDEPAKAALALPRVQATQVYAGLKLWPDAVMARLAEAQLVADGTYPNAAAVFSEQGAEVVADAREVGEIPRASGGFWPEGKEPRDWHGRWTVVGGEAPSRDPALVRVAQNDPIAGCNSDIDQKIDEKRKQQGQSSGLFHYPNPGNPSEVLRAALQPLGTAGAGGKSSCRQPLVQWSSRMHRSSWPLPRSSECHLHQGRSRVPVAQRSK